MGKYERAPNQLGINKEGLGKSVENRQLRDLKDGRAYRTDNQLHEVFPVDAAALRMLDEESDFIIKKLFANAEITWKFAFKDDLSTKANVSANVIRPYFTPSLYKTPTTNTKSDSAQVRDNLLNPGTSFEQYKKSAANQKIGIITNTRGAVMNASDLMGLGLPGFLDRSCSSENKNEVYSALLEYRSGFEVEWMTSMTPIAGLVMPLGSALMNVTKAVVKEIKICKLEEHERLSLAGNTAEQAINAILKIMERELNADLFGASVALCEFGGKLATFLCDGGTASNAAVGLAANITKLINIVRIINRDVTEKNAANEAIKEGRIDLQIFDICPLLGCYLIVCAPTSVLMNRILKNFGELGWMNQGEKVIKEHIKPIREKAKQVIKKHRFEIKSLEKFQGMGEVNKAELKRMGII